MKTNTKNRIIMYLKMKSEAMTPSQISYVLNIDRMHVLSVVANNPKDFTWVPAVLGEHLLDLTHR